MPVIDLANPTRFLASVNRVLPWLIAATIVLFAVGLFRAMNAPDDYQQGATVKIMFLHVPAAWLGMLGWARDERCRARHAGMAASAGRCRRQGRRADRRRVHLHLPRHRLALGPPDLGHLLGVGRAADVDAGAVAALSRRAGALLDRRRSRPRRARRGDPVAGRRGQSSDHQVLGRLVEHAAPAGLGLPHRWLDDRSVDSDAAPDHGAGLHAAVFHAASRRHAQRNLAPARAQHAA